MSRNPSILPTPSFPKPTAPTLQKQCLLKNPPYILIKQLLSSTLKIPTTFTTVLFKKTMIHIISFHFINPPPAPHTSTRK